VMVPPPHEPVRPLGVATESPVGNVSLNAMPVSAVEALGLEIVKASDDEPPTVIDAGAKLLAIAGGDSGFTVSVALAVLPVPLWVVAPAGVVSVGAPPVVPVTLTENVHLILAARVAPARLPYTTLFRSVMVPPPHDPVRPLGVATRSPAGNASVNATPVSAVE